MKQIKAKILENKKIAQEFYRMRLESPYLAKNAKPGQFLEVKCSDQDKPLLRRPLGVHRILKNGIEMLYRRVGTGTELLSKKKIGGYLDILGPLGNGFTLPRTTNNERRTTILIAGGVGVAPLLALAEKIAYSVERIAYRKKRQIYVFIGGKTKKHILCEEEFKKIGCEVKAVTEDGSKGHKGLVTDILIKFLRSTQYAVRSTIYACGPMPMLKAVAKIAMNKRIPCQVLLEERMACGVGVCLGCPVKVRASSTQNAVRRTQYEYKMVCKDGPVFNAEEIAW